MSLYKMEEADGYSHIRTVSPRMVLTGRLMIINKIQFKSQMELNVLPEAAKLYLRVINYNMFGKNPGK